MKAPEIQPPTLERLKVILADQAITIDQQAQYIQQLIAVIEAAEERAPELPAVRNGVQIDGAKAKA